MAPKAYSSVELTDRFKKSFKRLSAAVQQQCEDALLQLVEEPIATGLRLKPIRPSNKYYEARINQGDRLIIYPVGDVAYVMDVVKHDEISRWSK